MTDQPPGVEGAGGEQEEEKKEPLLLSSCGATLRYAAVSIYHPFHFFATAFSSPLLSLPMSSPLDHSLHNFTSALHRSPSLPRPGPLAPVQPLHNAGIISGLMEAAIFCRGE